MKIDIEFQKPSKQQKSIQDVIDLLPGLMVSACGGAVTIKDHIVRHVSNNGRMRETKIMSFVITNHITAPYSTFLILMEKMRLLMNSDAEGEVMFYYLEHELSLH